MVGNKITYLVGNYKQFVESSKNSQLYILINIKSCLYYSESGRSIPPMSEIFRKESNHHWILSSLHTEIIEHSHSLSFPRKGILIVILHMFRTEATFKSDVRK